MDSSDPDSPGISVDIAFDDWQAALPQAEQLIVTAARAALAAACPGIGPAGVAFLLTDDAAMTELNRAWRGKDGSTNVLSFPATETREGEMPVPDFPGVPLELGDVAIACETCIREATEQKKTLADHVQHLTVHGVLHLIGYDHMAEDEAVRMERLEAIVLAGLGVADPYAAERDE
jgi:probable rRNA maturation factor